MVTKTSMIRMANSLYAQYSKSSQKGGADFIVPTTDMYKLNDLDYSRDYEFAPSQRLDSAMYSKFEI